MPHNKPFLIAITDDDLDDHDLVKMALKETEIPFEVASLYNGLQLMDLLLRREGYQEVHIVPDLILLDINMPMLDGFGVLEQMRAHQSLSRIPVYVISTTRNPAHVEKALSLGAKGFYSKPGSFPELKHIITQVCSDCFLES